MRLVNSVYDLARYSLCSNETEYFESISNTQDINLFYRLPVSSSAFNVTVETVNPAGLGVLTDVTSMFLFVVGLDKDNQPYAVVKGKASQALPYKFILKLTIENAESVTYTLFTEPYELASAGCNNSPLMKLEGDYVCYDQLEGRYYGSPLVTIASNFCTPGDVCSLRYENTCILRAMVERVPTNVDRRVTEDTCRSTSTVIARLYDLIGLEMYPIWKMNEIENIFAANAIRINNDEVIYRGGAIFEKDDISCTCSFKLKARIEECPVTMIYGCEPACKFICWFYLIPADNKNQAYFDDKGVQIAATYAELINWFYSQYGAEEVTDLNIEGWLCQVVGALRVSSSNILPAYIFYKKIAPENRIPARIQDCSNDELCDTAPPPCVTPAITSGNFINGCTTPEVISFEFVATGTADGACTVYADEDWTGTSSATHSGTSATLTVSLTSGGGIAPSAYFADSIATVGADCRPKDLPVTVAIDADNQVTIYPDGVVFFAGYFATGTTVIFTVTYSII